MARAAVGGLRARRELRSNVESRRESVEARASSEQRRSLFTAEQQSSSSEAGARRP